MTRKKKFRAKSQTSNYVSSELEAMSENLNSNTIDHPIETNNENPVINSEQTMPPIASKVMFWRPRYLGKSQWLQQIPFYFWLTEVLQPKIVVDPNVNSGVGYFAICQAIDKLNQDGLIYGALGSQCDAERITTYNHEHYREFSNLVIEKEKKFISGFVEHSIDLLLLKHDSLLLSGKNDLAGLRQRMSPNGVVLIHGSLMDSLREQTQFLKSRYLTFELNQAPGLLLLCFGSKIPPRLEALIKQSREISSQRLIQNIYARLGSASEDAWYRLVQERELKELRENLSKVTFDLQQSESEKNGQKQRISKLENELEFNKSVIIQTQQKTEKIERQCTLITNQLGIKEQQFESSSQQYKDEIFRLKSEIKNLKEINAMLERDQEVAANKISVLTQSESVLQQSLNTRFDELAVLTKLLHENEKQFEARIAELSINKELMQQSKKTAMTEKFKNKISAAKQNRIKVKKFEKDVELIRNSELFDDVWYIQQNPDSSKHKYGAAGHYLEKGIEPGINPSPLFDGEWYLQTYQDVKTVGVNPLFHYIKYGRREERQIKPNQYPQIKTK